MQPWKKYKNTLFLLTLLIVLKTIEFFDHITDKHRSDTHGAFFDLGFVPLADLFSIKQVLSVLGVLDDVCICENGINDVINVHLFN